MPSVNSSSVPMVLDSSTVITPSLPTLSKASASRSPITLSRLEIVATDAMSSRVSTSRAASRSASPTASAAASMPRLRPIGLAPAATARRPSWTIAWASTVAVVVPSPATSLVLVATSLVELGAEVLERVVELDLTGDGHAVVGDGGGAPLLVEDDVAALGAERHLDGVGERVDAALERRGGRSRRTPGSWACTLCSLQWIESCAGGRPPERRPSGTRPVRWSGSGAVRNRRRRGRRGRRG